MASTWKQREFILSATVTRELDTETDPDNRMKYDRVFFDDVETTRGIAITAGVKS